MKEKPIIMSSESIRAILAGRKTQTRRIVKSPYKDEYGNSSKGPFKFISTESGFSTCLDLSGDGLDGDGYQQRFICQYELGLRIWVKESWLPREGGKRCFYKADYDDSKSERILRLWSSNGKWRNPMFMPREFSRLTLEVTGVRLERIQEMNGGNIYAEGFPPIFSEFQKSWDKLNAKRGFSWESNPYVWVIEFKRIEN